MNEEQLSEAVHGSLADVPIAPPPLEHMHRAATRVRRARMVVVSAVAATVVVVAGIAAWSGTRDDPGSNIAPMAPTDGTPPPGSKYVGSGHVVVAVPESWVYVAGRESEYCGAESDDVLVYNTPDCHQANQDAIHIFQGKPADLLGWDEIEIGGERAYRMAIKRSHAQAGDGRPTVWTGSTFLPREQVIISGVSSRSADALAEMLETVDVLPGYVAVPDFQDANATVDPVASYRAALAEAGLEVQVVEEDATGSVGQVTGVRPERGLAVPIGTPVTVQVSRGGAG